MNNYINYIIQMVQYKRRLLTEFIRNNGVQDKLWQMHDELNEEINMLLGDFLNKVAHEENLQEWKKTISDIFAAKVAKIKQDLGIEDKNFPIAANRFVVKILGADNEEVVDGMMITCFDYDTTYKSLSLQLYLVEEFDITKLLSEIKDDVCPYTIVYSTISPTGNIVHTYQFTVPYLSVSSSMDIQINDPARITLRTVYEDFKVVK